MSSPGRAVPKQELLDEVWNEPFGQANLVDWVHQNVTGRPAEVAMFWTAYIITRPLGASFADWLALPPSRDGIGLGTGLVTVLWGVAIAVLVSFLALTRRDVESDEPLLG